MLLHICIGSTPIHKLRNIECEPCSGYRYVLEMGLQDLETGQYREAVDITLFSRLHDWRNAVYNAWVYAKPIRFLPWKSAKCTGRGPSPNLWLPTTKLVICETWEDAPLFEMPWHIPECLFSQDDPNGWL